MYYYHFHYHIINVNLKHYSENFLLRKKILKKYNLEILLDIKKELKKFL